MAINTFLDNNGSKEKSKRKFLKIYIETNENGSTIYKNLWDAKAVLKEKIIMLITYIKKKKSK